MGQIRSGMHQQLDDAATELIRKSLEGVTSMSEKSDVLTPWKETDRRRREVYTAEGTPDGALRRGMYHRAWNSTRPHLNSIDGRVSSLPGDLLGGAAPHFHRDSNAVEVGEIYDLRISFGRQMRIKCPLCAKYMRDALEITCRCGSIFSKVPDAGHYQVVRIHDGR